MKNEIKCTPMEVFKHHEPIQEDKAFKYKCEDCNKLLEYCWTFASLDHEGKPTLVEKYHCNSCHIADVHYIGRVVRYDGPSKCAIIFTDENK